MTPGPRSSTSPSSAIRTSVPGSAQPTVPIALLDGRLTKDAALV
jgi:hypothetical protein